MAEVPKTNPREFWANLSADQIISVDIVKHNSLKVWITLQTEFGRRQYFIGKSYMNSPSDGIAFPFPSLSVEHAIFIVTCIFEKNRDTGKSGWKVQVGKPTTNYGYGLRDDDLIFEGFEEDDGMFTSGQYIYCVKNPKFVNVIEK